MTHFLDLCFSPQNYDQYLFCKFFIRYIDIYMQNIVEE